MFGVLESEMKASRKRLFGDEDPKANSKWKGDFGLHFDSFELRDISSPVVDFRTVAFDVVERHTAGTCSSDSTAPE